MGEEEVVESTERSTRLSPVEKVQFRRFDAATTTSPWRVMVTLHSVGDNKRLYFLISRKRSERKERISRFFQQKRGGEVGEEAVVSTWGTCLGSGNEPLLFCFGAFFFFSSF